MIGEYASMYGNLAAVRHFTKKLGVEVKESSVRTWKVKYRAEVERKKRGGDKGELRVEKLHVKKRGRPLLLGEKLDDEVKCYSAGERQSDNYYNYDGSCYGYSQKK